MGNSPVKFSWSGVDGLISKIERHRDKMPEILGRVLMMEGEELIAAAKPLVPVLHGFLRSSGFVQLPEINKASGQVSIEAGFGGIAGSGNQGGSNLKDVGYAVYVHEDMTKHHQVGQAKFLEQPFRERMATMSDRLAGRIEEQLNALG